MADTDTPTRKIQVANSRPEDSGRGLAHLPRTLMAALGVGEGDVIEIVGKQSTPARAVAPYPEDEGLELLRIDGLQRANAGVGSGDFVEVRKAESKPATRVVFAPAQQNLRLQGSTNALKRTFIGRPFCQGDVVATAGHQRVADMPPNVARFMNAPAYALQEIRLAVVSASPKGIVHIDENTEIELRAEYEEPSAARRADVTYDDIGGMAATIDQLREMVELPLRYPELFQRLGVDPPKGVLLHGPPGTGKTRLARAVANESDAQFFLINGPEIMGSAYGESEGRLREVFEEATKAAPSIVFIDEIDSIAPKRGQVQGEAEKRLVAQLLTLMDGLEARANLVVIAATNRPEAIDEALRRPGRFDREIVVGVPDERGRREILGIHTRGMPLGDRVDLDELARTTYGFVGADIAALAREAAIEAVRRIMPKLNLEERTIPPEVLDTLSVTREDFLEALKRVQPIGDARGDGAGADRPLGGCRRARRRAGATEGRRRAAAQGPRRVPPARHPPGQGLPALRPARHRQDAAGQGGGARGGGELHRHQVERPAEQMVWRERAADRPAVQPRAPGGAVRDLHRRARLAWCPRAAAALGEPQVTERVVNTILAEMDGLEELQSVVVIGATNRPNLIDPALLRPGRFDELIYVGVPERGGPAAHPAASRRRRCRWRTTSTSTRSRARDRPVHRRRPGGRGAPRRPGRAAARRSTRREVTMADFDEALKRIARERHARDGARIRADGGAAEAGCGGDPADRLHRRRVS